MSYNLLAIESIWLAVGFGLGSFLIVSMVEAIILFLFRLNPFGRCFRDSILANIGSGLLCLLLMLILNKVEIEWLSHLMIFSFFFVVSSIFETWIIRLLNSQLTWGKILPASFVMNLITYAGGYYFFTSYMF